MLKMCLFHYVAAVLLIFCLVLDSGALSSDLVVLLSALFGVSIVCQAQYAMVCQSQGPLPRGEGVGGGVICQTVPRILPHLWWPILFIHHLKWAFAGHSNIFVCSILRLGKCKAKVVITSGAN